MSATRSVASCPDCGAEDGEAHHPYCYSHPAPDAFVTMACGCPRWEAEAIGHQEGCSR